MTIRTFIKENLVLVIGLSLPLLLIVLFFVATVIPKSMASPPQYEMLFTVSKYDYQNAPDYLLSYAVKDRQLVIEAKKNEDKPINFNQSTLMMYDPKAEAMREIRVDSKIAETALGKAVIVEETKSYEIDNSMTAPDGYSLEGPNYQDSGLMGGLFGGGYRNAQYRIVKGSIAYPLPRSVQLDYYNQVKFIGWVIKK